MTKNKKLNKFQDKIKYHFSDEELLLRALTHPSHSAEAGLPRIMSNQRLEFLGDAVLEIVVSDYLFDEHPDAEEGELTRRRSSLVFEAALCRCAREIGLGDYLLLGVGEDSSGGREKPSILADAFEALTGAIYLDGGIKKAKKFIYRFVIGAIDEMSLISDKKSVIQSYAQKRHSSIRYETAPCTSRADASFRTVLYLGGKEIAKGFGTNKKNAEQDAAARACRRLNVR